LAEVLEMARILVIDDDQAICEDVARFLERAGHQVATALNGKQALRLFEVEPADLVITDIYMPEMDGLDFILALRKLRSGIPVVAISGGGLLPPKWLLDDADDIGAFASIEKPFDLDVLLRVVERALGEGGEKDRSM